MGEPKTQDLHKVFNSATTRLKSFMDGVQNVSGSKNIELIYKNIGRMVDAFTRGKLTEQGANSEELFRQIYRSLDDNFIEIIQSQTAVDKIIELMGEHADESIDNGVDKENKSIDLSYDIGVKDPVKLVVDFLEELQNDVFDIYRKLSRQYTKQKFKYDKWQRQQESQIDEITNIVDSYDQKEKEVQDQIDQIANDDQQYIDDINKTKKLLDTFSKIEGTNQDLYSGLGKLSNVVSSIETKMKSSFSMMTKKEKNPSVELIKEGFEKKSKFTEKKFPEDAGAGSKSPVEKHNQDFGKYKKINGVEQNSKLNSNKIQTAKDIGNKSSGLPNKQDKNTKLNIKPSSDDMCVCPICGGRHGKGVHSQGNLTEQGVTITIGQIHKNITALVNNEKFKNRFMLGYKKINSGIQKQMKKIDKDEALVDKDLEKTEKGIKKLKKPKPGSSILRILLQPAALINIAVIALGGLILITLTRMALKKFKDTYMPPSDGQKVSLFGVEIPGFAEIKSLIIGIRNFIVVGLPNRVERISSWLSKINKKMFGKKGIFASFDATRRTLKKIALAFLIGKSKGIMNGGKTILKAIWWVVKKCVNLIPGVGAVISVIIELLPAILTYIQTQLMLMWNREKEDETQKLNDLVKKFSNKQVNNKLKRASRKVKPFVRIDQMPGIGLEVPNMANKTGRFKSQGAIMRDVRVSAIGDASAADASFRLGLKKSREQYDSDAAIHKYEGGENIRPGDKTQENLFKGHRALFDVHSRLKEGEMGSSTKELYDEFINPQRQKLQEYINRINEKIKTRENRFREEYNKPLYDPDTGWNPAYAVRKSELMTAIPNDFFEEIHTKDDISLGKPSGTAPNNEWIGIMPFTWLPANGKISVHADPLRYDRARAQRLINLYSNYGWYIQNWVREAGEKRDWSWWWIGDTERDKFISNGKKTLGEYIRTVQRTCDSLANPVFFSYYETQPFAHARDLSYDSDGEKIYFGDDFTNFLSSLREGTYMGNRISDVVRSASVKAHEKYHEENSTSNQDTRVTTWIAKNDYVGNERYDENADKHRAQRKGQAQSYATSVIQELKKFKGNQYTWSTYGWTRAFFDKVSQALGRGVVFNSRSGADEIAVGYTKSKKIGVQTFDGTVKYPELFSLISDYFIKYNIADAKNATNYWWQRLATDDSSQMGFAHSIIEYFGYIVAPQWNKVESLISQYISSDKTAVDEKTLRFEIGRLVDLCQPAYLYSHLNKHLRFPNIHNIIITDQNATEEQKKQIDKYRKLRGIPNQEEKINILHSLGNSLPTDLDGWKKRFRYIYGLMKGAKMEADATGDFQFIDALTQLLNNATQNINGFEGDASHIVIKPGDIPKIVAMPTRTKEEMEKIDEENKKKEQQRKKLEQEQRMKKLAEEAERKKKIAEAKIKIEEMEKIRKQEKIYEELLSRLINDAEHVTENDLKAVKDEVEDLKQEAENRINELPRDKRDVRLALLRGDKVSAKSFKELKDTAIGLHGSLQAYVEEVHKIPCGSIMSIQNTSLPNTNQVRMADSDSVDMGND